MRPLVAVRRAAPFDPSFIGRDSLLWPLTAAAAALGPHDDFPPVETLHRVFRGDPPIRFVDAAPRRRRRSPIDAHALYDARIALYREVPTRAQCWHDLMNALVWGTFPRAKRALHERQHEAIRARIEPGARTLPPRRSSELDALALLDEGGLLVLSRDVTAVNATLRGDRSAFRLALGEGSARIVVFGHAIHESLVLGVPPAVVAAVVLPAGVEDDSDALLLKIADDRLAEWLANPANAATPRELARVDLADVRGGKGAAPENV
jgi:hypothetical protein